MLKETFDYLSELADILNTNFSFVDSLIQQTDITAETINVPNVSNSPNFSLSYAQTVVDTCEKATVDSLQKQVSDLTLEKQELQKEKEELLLKTKSTATLANDILATLSTDEPSEPTTSEAVKEKELSIIPYGARFTSINMGSNVTLSEGDSVVTMNGSGHTNSFVPVHYNSNNGNCTIVFTRLDGNGDNHVAYGWFRTSDITSGNTMGSNYCCHYAGSVYNNGSSQGSCGSPSNPGDSVIVSIYNNTVYIKCSNNSTVRSFSVPNESSIGYRYHFGVVLYANNSQVHVK
ncbi:hypothetical protein GEMRC1_002071 [Eukaryota sp. GEM-RC1]